MYVFINTIKWYWQRTVCMCNFTQLGNSILFRIKQSTDFLVHSLEGGIASQMVNKCSLKLLPETVTQRFSKWRACPRGLMIHFGRHHFESGTHTNIWQNSLEHTEKAGQEHLTEEVFMWAELLRRDAPWGCLKCNQCDKWYSENEYTTQSNL